MSSLKSFTFLWTAAFNNQSVQKLVLGKVESGGQDLSLLMQTACRLDVIFMTDEEHKAQRRLHGHNSQQGDYKIHGGVSRLKEGWI